MVDTQMIKEWEAWKAMCRVLRTMGVEINNEDELATAIKTWGEEFVTLRQARIAAEGRPPNNDTPRAYYKAQEGNSY